MVFKKVTYVTYNGVLYGLIDDVTQEYVGTDLVIGYTFDMQVKIPKFYRVAANSTSDTIIKSDTRASLIIHRFTLDAGATGTFDCTLKRLGYADYVETFEANTMDTYKSNTPNLANQITRNISCYCRNTNLDIILSSQHPHHLPCILLLGKVTILINSIGAFNDGSINNGWDQLWSAGCWNRLRFHGSARRRAAQNNKAIQARNEHAIQ